MASLVIARLTFIEAIRRRILLAAFLLGVAFLFLFGVGFYFMNSEVRGFYDGAVGAALHNSFYAFLVNAGLYAVNFLAIAMGALVSADTLAGEINSGTIQTMATKPVRRAQIVLGKWLGFAGLLALYLMLMFGGVLAIAYFLVGYTAPNVLTGALMIFLETLLIMSITMACSSVLSTLATGGVVFGLYGIAFIGGWVEQFGAALSNQMAVNIGIISSLIIPSEAVWRRAVYEMTPAVTQSLGFTSGGPFISISVPSVLMIQYAMMYIVAALSFAIYSFSKRDL